MTQRRNQAVGVIAVAGSFLSMIGVGFWRALKSGALEMPRDSGPALLPSGAERGNIPPTRPQLQDLSGDTPGATELDWMARRAAAEERDSGGRGDLERSRSLPVHATRAWDSESSRIADVLEHQSLGSEPIAGWSRPRLEKLPVPTFAPAVMAFGIVVFAMGIATTWYVCVAGSIVFAVAAWRWTGELQGE